MTNETLRIVDLTTAKQDQTVLLVPSEDGLTLRPIMPEDRVASMDGTGVDIRHPTVLADTVSPFKRKMTVREALRMGFSHATAVDWRTWLTAIGVRGAACWALNYGEFKDMDAAATTAEVQQHMADAADRAKTLPLWCVTVAPSDLDRRVGNTGSASGYMLAKTEDEVRDAARYGGKLFSDFVFYGQFDPRRGDVRMMRVEG